METNSLITGKNEELGIVAIEIEDDVAVIYEQDLETGIISRREEGHRFWVLASQALDERFRRLDGNLHYQYGALVKSKKEFYEIKNRYGRQDRNLLYSVSDAREQHMIRYGRTYFKGLKHEQVSVLAFDIETTGLEMNDESRVILITNTFRDHKGNITRKLFCYDEYENDGEFLKAWCDWVVSVDPSVLLVHHGHGYDFPFLDFHFNKAGVAFNLGRQGKPVTFGSPRYPSKFRKDGDQSIEYNKVYIPGRSICDTFFLAISFDIARDFTSYGLKSLIKELGKDKKDRVYYDASKIRDNYLIPEEMVKIKAYAIDDADDCLTLWDHMGTAFFYSANNIPKDFTNIINSASGSQINSILVRAYLQDGHSIPKTSELRKLKGGISIGLPGIYRNCWKLDMKSAYPSGILVNKLYSKAKDPKAYFLQLCEHFTFARFELKKKFKETQDPYYAGLDATAKRFINSMFGVTSTSGLNFNDPAIAEKITQQGRDWLSQGMVWATGKDANYWISQSSSAEEEVLDA